MTAPHGIHTGVATVIWAARSIHMLQYGTIRIHCGAVSITWTWYGHSVGILSTIAGMIPSTGISTTALTTIRPGTTPRSTMITGTARSTMDITRTTIQLTTAASTTAVITTAGLVTTAVPALPTWTTATGLSLDALLAQQSAPLAMYAGQLQLPPSLLRLTEAHQL